MLGTNVACEEKEERRSADVEELVVVKEVVSEVFDKIGSIAKEIVSANMASLDGKKLSQEIAEFYTNIKSAGIPDEIAQEMVREFYRKKLELAPSLNELARSLTEVASKGRVVGTEKAKEVGEGKKESQ
jgi:hypothetical protein